MDPNQNLREQGRLLREQQAFEPGSRTYTEIGQERAEMASYLTEWLNGGGFEPDWQAEPDGTEAWKEWLEYTSQVW